jgi:formylglycine-generating enzyme required for sulfatase activity
MRRFFLFIILAFGCTSHKYNYDIIRKIPKQKLTPPGTVWIRDNLFIDETEVTNFGYYEFLYYLKSKDTAKHSLMLPDSTCWTRADVGFNQSNPLIRIYFKSQAYRNYPVIGISYEQAVEFCNWRSDRTNEFLYYKNNKREKGLNNKEFNFPKKVRFRLPTKEEWEYAAAAGLNYNLYPLGYESLTNNKNQPANNTLEYYTLLKKVFTDKDTLVCVDPTEPVFSGKPNRYGLYQMLGNVSELIEDGLVKGLNYSKPIYFIEREEESNVIRTQTYNYKLTEKYKRPEPWIGFRCVCEVLEK